MREKNGTHTEKNCRIPWGRRGHCQGKGRLCPQLSNLQKQRQEAEALSKKIAGITVTIEHRVGEEERLFGSVTAADISAKLAEEGVDIDKKNILLPEPIKSLGEFVVPVKVGYQVTTDIAVQVTPLEAEA